VSNEPHQFSKLADELVGELRGLSSPKESDYTIGGRRVRPKTRATQPLMAVVEQLLQQHRIGREAPEHTIRDHWAEIVGAANAAYSHPAQIERNRLTVLVPHAVVRNELFHHRAEIVARVRKLPGCADVKSLNLRAG